MRFGGDIRARQLERSIGGLQGQGYCVESLSLIRGGRDFFMLMRDDFLLLFPKRTQGLCMPVFRLACVSNSQSSYVVAEKLLHCVVLLYDKLFSASMTMLFIVTNLVLAICHA